MFVVPFGEMWDNESMASLWSSRNLSGTRDAVLINGLATLAGCVSIVLAYILDPHGEAFGPGLGVALSATGVLLVWSLTLAVRAWRRGEHNGWCWAVMILGGPETVLLGAIAYLIRFVFPSSSGFQWTLQWVWQWAWENCVFVILPAGAIAYLVAALVTWWRLRRAAKRQPRSHWKRGLIWFCAVFALLSALLLPWPLFYYCSEREFYSGEGRSWKTWVLEHTPVFVADIAAGGLTLSSHPSTVHLYHCALWSGRVSKNRLLAEVNSTDPTAQQSAFGGLERADPQAALALADQIGQARTSGTWSGLVQQAGGLMARRGTLGRVRYYLDQDTTQSPQPSGFMDGLFESLSGRSDCLPELVSSCRKGSPYRQAALNVLAQRLPPKDVPGVWAEFLADSDPLRRQQAVWAIAQIRDLWVRFEMIVAGFESPDLSLRQQMLQHYLRNPYWDFWEHRFSTPALMRLVQSLLPVLDDADRGVRCGAACRLSRFVDDHGTLQKEFTFFSSFLLSRLRGRNPVGAEPEEPEMLESVRAAAKKWLDEHK